MANGTEGGQVGQVIVTGIAVDVVDVEHDQRPSVDVNLPGPPTAMNTGAAITIEHQFTYTPPLSRTAPRTGQAPGFVPGDEAAVALGTTRVRRQPTAVQTGFDDQGQRYPRRRRSASCGGQATRFMDLEVFPVRPVSRPHFRHWATSPGCKGRVVT